MRAVVHEASYVVPAHEVGESSITILGVYDTGRGVTAEEIREVARFSDQILRIRNQRCMVPQRTPAEMVAHVICDDAVDDNYDPGNTPNERYFAAVDDRNRMLGFAALDRTVVEPPHELKVREIGVTNEVASQPDVYEGVLAALFGAILAHAEERDWINRSRAHFSVRSLAPSPAGMLAMRVFGFIYVTREHEFRTRLPSVRRGIETRARRIA